MPAYNTAGFIWEAIKSVLVQEGEVELIVVNDGSTDETAKVISLFNDVRMSVITLPENTGMANAVRVGMEKASGDLIAVMGSDDRLMAGYAKAMEETFRNPKIGVATCHQKLMDADGQELKINIPKHLKDAFPRNTTPKIWKVLLYHGQIAGFGVPMFRKSALDQVGGFDQSYAQLQDLECYLKLMRDGYEIAVVERPLTWYRVRKGQMSEPNEANGKVHTEQMKRIRAKHYFYEGAPMKLMIATPFYSNQGFSPYIRSLFQTVYTLARHTSMEFDFQEVSGGSYIDHNRNMMADAFLKSDSTHLMFIDSDHSWDIPGLLNVLRADVDVVGAAYPVKNNWQNFGVTIHTDEDFRPIVNAAGLIKADKVPTGFMKIRRCVFERIAAANPNDWYWHGEHDKLQNYFGHLTLDHVRYGEDISFGIRWQRVGGEIWVEPRVNMGHFGAQGWFGNYHEFLCKQAGGSQDPAALLKLVA